MEIFEIDGKYGLRKTPSHQIVLSAKYDMIEAVERWSALLFILSLKDSQFFFDGETGFLSEEFKLVKYLDPELAYKVHYDDAPKPTKYIGPEPYLLIKELHQPESWHTVFGYDTEKCRFITVGYARNATALIETLIRGSFIFLNIGRKVGLAILGWTNSILLPPIFDNIRFFVYPDTDEVIIEGHNGDECYPYIYDYEKNELGQPWGKKYCDKGIYGQYYVALLRENRWEMFSRLGSLIGVGDDFSNCGSEPYVAQEGRLLIGSDRASFVWCDAITELWENTLNHFFMKYAICRVGERLGLWKIGGQQLWGDFQDIQPLYKKGEDGSKEITHFLAKYKNGEDGLFDVNDLTRNLLKA